MREVLKGQVDEDIDLTKRILEIHEGPRDQVSVADVFLSKSRDILRTDGDSGLKADFFESLLRFLEMEAGQIDDKVHVHGASHDPMKRQGKPSDNGEGDLLLRKNISDFINKHFSIVYTCIYNMQGPLPSFFRRPQSL